MTEKMKDTSDNKKEISKIRLFMMVLALALGYFLCNFHRLSLGVAGVVISKDFGMTSVQLGMMGAMFFYAYAIMQIPAGILTDRIGSKLILLFSAILSAGATLWFSMAQDIAGLAASRALTGFAVAFVYVPAVSSLRYWFGDARFGTMTGILVAVGQLGALFASLPLQLMTDTIGWRNAFAIIGYTHLALFILIWFVVLKEDKKQEKIVKKQAQSWKKSFTPIAIAIMFWFFIGGGTRYAFQSIWASTFYIKVLGRTTFESSTYLMWISVGCTVGAIALGRLCDYLGSIKTLILSSIVLTATWFTMIFLTANTPGWAITAISLILGVVGAGGFTVAFTCVREISGGANTGLLTGINGCSAFLGSAVFTQFSGSIMSIMKDLAIQASFQYLFSIFTILCVLTTAAIMILNKRRAVPKIASEDIKGC